MFLVLQTFEWLMIVITIRKRRFLKYLSLCTYLCADPVKLFASFSTYHIEWCQLAILSQIEFYSTTMHPSSNKERSKVYHFLLSTATYLLSLGK